MHRPYCEGREFGNYNKQLMINLMINHYVIFAKDGETMRTSGIGKINMTTIVRGEEKHGSMNNVLVIRSATIYLNNEVVGVAKLDRGFYRLNALHREISSNISFPNKNLA